MTPTEDVLSLLDDVIGAARARGRDDQVARLSGVRQRLARPARHVVVVGEFKKGKSSLVNALLNARLCPTDADIATAVPSYIGYGASLTVRALPEGDPLDGAPLDGAPLDDRADSAAIDMAAADDGARGALRGVRALDIRIPRELLRDGLVLVDTPGVGGGLSSAHAAVALRALRATASVALVVCDASAEYSAAELDFISAVAGECPQVIVALTKIDLYPNWRDIAEADRAHLDRLGCRAELIPVSSVLRGAGLREADDDLLVESGFPLLTDRLVTATHERTRPRAGDAAAAARSITAQLVVAATAERAALAGGAATGTAGSGTAGPGTAAEWEADELLAAELRSAGSRWQQVLSDQMGDLQAENDVDLVTRIRALRKEAVAKVAELPAQRMAADLGPWLQRRTNEELLDHVRFVRVAADRVADGVADQFGRAARAMRAGISVVVDTDLGNAATDVAFDVGGRDGVAAEPGLAALRGGATGTVVANAVGLAFSFAVPVLIPVTIALAGALAAKSWRSARAGQERQLRMDLERAIVAYLDDVDVVARKDSRASVRRIQRHLRETFAERATELYETARRTAAELRASAARGEAERHASLADLDGEIERLRALHARAGRAVAAGLVGGVTDS